MNWNDEPTTMGEKLRSNTTVWICCVLWTRLLPFLGTEFFAQFLRSLIILCPEPDANYVFILLDCALCVFVCACYVSVCLCACCVCGCIIPDSHCWDTSPNEVKQSDKWDYTTNRKYAIICYSSWVECVRDDAKWKMRFSFWYKWDWPTRLLFACIDQTSFLSFSVSLCSSEQDKPSATWEHRIRSKDKPKIISESLDHF